MTTCQTATGRDRPRPPAMHPSAPWRGASFGQGPTKVVALSSILTPLTKRLIQSQSPSFINVHGTAPKDQVDKQRSFVPFIPFYRMHMKCIFIAAVLTPPLSPSLPLSLPLPPRAAAQYDRNNSLVLIAPFIPTYLRPT